MPTSQRSHRSALTCSLLISLLLSACGSENGSNVQTSAVNGDTTGNLSVARVEADTASTTTVDPDSLPGVGIIESTEGFRQPEEPPLDEYTAAQMASEAPVAPPIENDDPTVYVTDPNAQPTTDATTGGVTAKATTKLTVKAPGTSLSANSSEFRRLFGPGVFNMNTLANTVIGTYRGYRSMTSNRFVATSSGTLSYVRIILVTGSGYSSGNGGTIRVTLRANGSNNLPNMNSVLASATLSPSLASNHGRSMYPQQIRFSSGAALQAGQAYHVVFENVNANPAQNFISINHAAMHSTNGRPSRWLNTTDWASLYASTPTSVQRAYSWFNLTRSGSSGNYFSPIMEVGLSNGTVMGVGDMESGSVDPARTYVATAQKPVRERFTPRQSRRISGLSVATSATVGGSMRWRLMRGSTQLATGLIQQSSANFSALTLNSGTRVARMVWYDVDLPSSILLNAGQNYDLEFWPQGSSQWKFGAHRNGTRYNFQWPAAFTESQAQHRLNGSWVNTHYWNYNYARSSGGTNWPVVLHLAQ